MGEQATVQLDKRQLPLKLITAIAPARICLFGDHQDYLELPIIACAIDRYIRIDCKAHKPYELLISMPDMNVIESIPLHTQKGTSLSPKGNYLAAAIHAVKSYGCIPDCGYTLTVKGSIPINAGLSSSSALTVSFVNWLLHTYGCTQDINGRLIGQIAYEAEVVLQNSPGGKMDQYTIGIGQTIFLETDTDSKHLEISHGLSGLIVGESGIPKDTIGLLGDLKGNALKAIGIVQKENPKFELAKATLVDYEQHKEMLPKSLQPYFYAAIKNHLITQEALLELQSEYVSYQKIGSLLNAHHKVLRDVLKITVPRIDQMISAAIEAGAYGAKIVGSGGGGSICALSPKGKEEKIIQAIKHAGAKDAYSVNICAGAHIL